MFNSKQSKTAELHIGQGELCNSLKILWVKDTVTLLGIKIGKNMDKNWDNKLEKVKNCLNVWKGCRDLSLIGRIHLIKSLAGSQLTYCWSTIQSPPEMFVKELNKIFYTISYRIVLWIA